MSNRKPIQCICSGNPDAPNLLPCPADATQEDFLCDHCRTVRCETRTNAEMSDPALCLRLRCPEHSIPGGAPIVAVF